MLIVLVIKYLQWTTTGALAIIPSSFLDVLLYILVYTYIESHVSIYQYVVIQSRYKPFIQEYTYYIYETIDNTA